MLIRSLGTYHKCLSRLAKGVSPSVYFQSKSLTTSPSNFVKEIHVKQEGNITTVEGFYKESERKPLLVKNELADQNVCALCALKLNIKHTDVLILSQFIRKDGCMLPRRVTGLCDKQQFRVTCLVAMAQRAGLMPNLNPPHSKKDPHLRSGSKKNNRYFEERFIPHFWGSPLPRLQPPRYKFKSREEAFKMLEKSWPQNMSVFTYERNTKHKK